MSQADELLKSVANTRTVNPETEPHIIIGEDRFITVPDELKRIAVQGDHDVETVTFDCPRYWDDHDLSKMQLYINYMRPDGTPGSHLAENVRVDEYLTDELDEWQIRESIPLEWVNDTINDIIYANGMYVAVGEDTANGLAYYSTDGVNWIKATGITYPVKCVTYGNGKFVAGGRDIRANGIGTVAYYSYDGRTWTPCSDIDSTASINSIAYGNGKFIAGGGSNQSFYSTDGINWNVMDMYNDFYHVAFGNDMFISTDRSNRISYSTDGISWNYTNKDIGDNKLASPTDIAYGNGMFVVVHYYGIYYSETGTKWTRIDFDMPPMCVTYGNGYFVAICENGTAYYSTEGIEWVIDVTLRDKIAGDFYIRTPCYAYDKFMVIGEKGATCCLPFKIIRFANI